MSAPGDRLDHRLAGPADSPVAAVEIGGAWPGARSTTPTRPPSSASTAYAASPMVSARSGSDAASATAAARGMEMSLCTAEPRSKGATTQKQQDESGCGGGGDRPLLADLVERPAADPGHATRAILARADLPGRWDRRLRSDTVARHHGARRAADPSPRSRGSRPNRSTSDLHRPQSSHAFPP